MWRALGLALVVAVGPGLARAHPHVYIDSGIDFAFDAEGRLTKLRVIWIYDPLTSLFMLEDLGIDAGGTAIGGSGCRVRPARTPN